MVSKTMVVKAAEGLHMRPAGVIAREALCVDSLIAEYDCYV